MNRKKHLRCEVKRLSVHGGCPGSQEAMKGVLIRDKLAGKVIWNRYNRRCLEWGNPV